MTATVASFRTLFSSFADTTKYPDVLIQTWLTVGVNFVNADRWGDSTDLGVSLFAAHQIVLEQRAIQTEASGGNGGATQGIQSSKSVDKVSVGYDVASIREEGAGYWNLTTYGQRYWRFAMMFGAGPVQVNTPGCAPDQSGTAWPGIIYPGF